MAKTCPSCGAPIDATATTCPYCGAAIPQEEKQTVYQPTAPTIIQQQVSQLKVKKHNRDKNTAAVLAFLLGGFGGDMFYLGKNSQGVIYLLITILTGGIGLFITAVIAIVHMVQYLSMSDEEFDNKYNY